MTFDDWWKDYGQDRDSAEYVVARDTFNFAQRELKERDVIIAFLKKELQKKTYCRQVMKRQYRELKQKYDALLEKQHPKDERFYNFFGR